MEKMFKQRLANYSFWGSFGGNHCIIRRVDLKSSFPATSIRQRVLKKRRRAGTKGSGTEKELESTGVKQFAEKLAMAADLLKYSPHSEITDVHRGICVNICNVLSMPFPSYLPPIRSRSLLPGHPLSESLSSFPKGRAGPTSPNRGHILFHSWRKGSAFLLPLTICPPPSLPCYSCPCSLYSSHTVFLLFFQHTKHALTPGLCTGCSLPEKFSSRRPRASFPSLLQVFTQISHSQWVWLWQPHSKQQTCPLYILPGPLSCSMFFVIPWAPCLIICF